LKKVRATIDQEYPGRVLIAEANQWPEDLLPYFGNGDEFHVCFHFPVMPRLYMSLKMGDKQPLVDILARTPDIPPGTQWMTFLRNHDELTLEMVTPEERQWMWEQYAPEPRMRQNLGIRRRLAPLLDNSRARWLLLNALLLSLPGTPIIYYGDENGMGDNIWLPDRHGCRTPMQWTAETNGGFSTAEKTYFPVNSDEVYGYQVVNVADQENDPNSYLWATRYLLQARSQNPALQNGEMTVIEIDNAAVFAYWLTHEGNRLLCIYNFSNQQQSVSFDLSAYKGRQMTDLLAQNRIETLNEWPSVKVLAPYSSHWFLIS
jgi:maltose alpha-D-glucosyltransferase/alpha-amylase